jgi:hypothetical protein
LAFDPGNVDAAVAGYQKWCKKLVEHDWPHCFDVSKVSASVSDMDLQKQVDHGLVASASDTGMKQKIKIIIDCR